jgi:hypothetical protein
MKVLTLLFLFFLFGTSNNFFMQENLAWSMENTTSTQRELRIKLTGNLKKNTSQYITVADLEILPLIEYAVEDPYIGKRVVYIGLLLSEFVKQYGQPDTSKIRLRAIEDYKTEFTKDEWTKWKIMLATRADGNHMGLREKGPVKIVMPYDTAKDINPTLYNPKWIWQINRIEFLK